jgi:hypothetical protein
MYAGCVSGAIQKDTYLGLIFKHGFQSVTIQKEKAIVIPDDILDKYLDTQALADMKSGNVGIYSITVYAEKPGAAKAAACCEPGSGCC